MPQQWFDGVYLLGQFNWFRTGCWLLHHQGEAALLEMPPAGLLEDGPASVAVEALSHLPGTEVKYLLCTHNHLDHFCIDTFRRMREAFPRAEPCLQLGFQPAVGADPGVRYFDGASKLHLAGEPLFLVHAPKHSETDTMVIFRGAACTGDWELGTLRSVHDWTWLWSVPEQRKLESIARMERFQVDHCYHIHRVWSVHANDRREGVDFPGLMASTRQDRPL